MSPQERRFAGPPQTWTPPLYSQSLHRLFDLQKLSVPLEFAQPSLPAIIVTQLSGPVVQVGATQAVQFVVPSQTAKSSYWSPPKSEAIS